MFTNLIYLILILFLVNVSGELSPETWSFSTLFGFFGALLTYFFFLLIIYSTIRINKKIGYRWEPKNAVPLLFLIYLISFFFVFGAQRLFLQIPIIGNFNTLPAVFSLILYFFAIGFAQYYSHHFNRWKQAVQPVRLMIPFAIPFLLFNFILDLLQLVPSSTLHELFYSQTENLLGAALLFFGSLVFMAFMLVIMPPIIMKIWQCKPLEPSPLKERLESLCQRAHFKHAGIKTWTILNHSLTAAILGIVPKLRYVIFTKRLLQELPPEDTEAILAHEIGHSRYNHLMIFPLILFGVVVSIELFSLLFAEGLNQSLALQMRLHPSFPWDLVTPIAIFVPYALIIGLYFRYIFGLFSRLFERQADLHGFELGINPESMIHALDHVGVSTGNTHKVPNWHHFSIQERIDFLQSAAKDPEVIRKHHLKTYRFLGGYVAILTILIIFLSSPLMPRIPPFQQFNIIIKKINEAVVKQLTSSFYKN